MHMKEGELLEHCHHCLLRIPPRLLTACEFSDLEGEGSY